MNYIAVRKRDIANGPGIRASIWVSGCTNQCADCFNQEAWDFKAGKELTKARIETFANFGKPNIVKGFSILGGEPLQQNHDDMLYFIKRLRQINKPIWIWTGYIFENLDDYQLDIVKEADVLIDGPFDKNKADPSLQFRGSSNQRIIDIKQTLQHDTIYLYKENNIC